MTNSPLKHIVFVAGSPWGHLRPALKFATRTIEKFPNVFISMFVHGPEAPKAGDYLTTQSLLSQKRIRIVPSVPLEASGQISGPLEAIILDMEKYFRLWIANELKVTGLAVDGLAIESPSWILEDQLSGGVGLASKSIHHLPVVIWWPGPAASWISHVGDAEYGHGGRLLGSVEAIYKRDGLANGKTFEELYEQELTNRLVCVPGLPAHYEHEQIPQLLRSGLSFVVPMIERWTYMVKNVAYIVICTTYEMEPIAAETLINALSKSITPFFVGPAVDPPYTLARTTIPSASISTSPVMQFLDRAYTDLGAHSVVYVAFGTAFFPLPQSIGHLTIILEEIIVHEYRIIFALSSATAKAAGLGDQFIEKVTSAGQALFPDWAEQADVLEHPAIHYFLSHGGWNSTIESVVRGVPMIFWPFAADQPNNTMQISTQQDCGFELIQVRTGPAKSVAYQQHSDVIITGTDEAVRAEIKRVLELSRGAKGMQQRRNVKALGKVVLDSLAKGGSGDVSLGRLGEILGLSVV